MAYPQGFGVAPPAQFQGPVVLTGVQNARGPMVYPQANVGQLVQQMGQLQVAPPIANRGYMSVKGAPGKATTYSGYTNDLMKVALEEYIERNMPEKAVIAAFELYRMSELPSGEAVRTSLYNRLAIISVNDIGPANLGLATLAMQINVSKNRDPNVLGALVQAMSGSQKTRLPVQIYTDLMTLEGRPIAQAMGLQIDDPATQEDIASLGRNGVQWLPADPMQIRPYAEIFKRRLQAQSMTCFIWLYYYMSIMDKLKIQARAIRPRRRQTDPIMIIWEILREFIAPPAWDAFVDSYLEVSDKKAFLVCATLCALYRVPYTPYNLFPLVESWQKSGTATRFLTGNYQFQVDEFIINMSSSAGKKNALDVVTPEDPRFDIPAFKAVYSRIPK